MSWVITAVVASTAASVYTSSVSAKAQQAQIQDQMKQEELAAKSEELARREELNAALAANAIDVSQSGVDAATFASLSLNSARQAGLAEGQEEQQRQQMGGDNGWSTTGINSPRIMESYFKSSSMFHMHSADDVAFA